jgi:uncharacterized ferritin-like protein (DUF455 family)
MLPVISSRKNLDAYLYSYLRTLELSCAWTMVVPELPFKVALGRVIGYLGVSLESIERRRGHMYSAGSKASAPQHYAAWIDEQVQLTDRGPIAAALVACFSDLVTSMNQYIGTRAHGDEPTLLLVQSLVIDLERAIKVLQPFADGSATVVSIDGARDGDVARAEYNGTEPLPQLPPRPARPAGSIHDPSIAKLPSRSLEESMKPEGLIAFFKHMYMEVEIAAIEVCSRNIIDHRDMPLAFKVDMTKQIWDEARHAELAVALVKHYGEDMDYDHMRYSGMVWDRHALGVDLAERLAIEQCIQEGSSCDRAAAMTPMLRKFGHPEAADAFDWINSDEVQHAAIGNRWLMWLCDNSRERYEAVLAVTNEKIKFPLPRPNRVMRTHAGFPSWYVDGLEKEFQATLNPRREA